MNLLKTYRIIPIFLLGCAPLGVFELQTGEIVICKDWVKRECGMDIYDCDTNADYYCQHNVKDLSWIQIPKKEIDRVTKPYCDLKKGTKLDI